MKKNLFKSQAAGRREGPAFGNLREMEMLRATQVDVCSGSDVRLETDMLSDGQLEPSGTEQAQMVSKMPKNIPVPDFPSLSIRLPQKPNKEDVIEVIPNSVNQAGAQTQGPPNPTAVYETLSYRELRDVCRKRGHARKDSKSPLCTR